MARVRWGVAALCAMVLTACAAEDEGGARPAEPVASETPDRTVGWRKVNIDATFRSIQASHGGVIATAQWHDGRPLLAPVREGIPDLTLPQPTGVPDVGLGGVSSDGRVVSVSDAHDPSAGTPARVWLSDDWQVYDIPQPVDRQGHRPTWLQPLLDQEEDQRLLGAVHVGDEWRLHAWEMSGTWQHIDDGPQLYLDGPPSPDNLAAGTTEVSVIVAGRISEQPGATEGPPQAWIIHSDYSFAGVPWERLPLDPAPDGLTHVAYWDVGFWVVGHRGLRPVVYDFDSYEDPGRMLEGPDMRLDPERPRAIIANTPVSEPMVMATQSVDGPAMWFETDNGWQEVPAPAGTLESAAVTEETAYLLIDGTLWYRTLPEAFVRPTP